MPAKTRNIQLCSLTIAALKVNQFDGKVGKLYDAEAPQPLRADHQVVQAALYSAESDDSIALRHVLSGAEIVYAESSTQLTYIKEISGTWVSLGRSYSTHCQRCGEWEQAFQRRRRRQC